MKNTIFSILPTIALCFCIFFMVYLNHHTNENFEQNFDIPLLEKSNTLLSLGNDTAYIKVNHEYLNVAKKKKYPRGEALCYIVMAKLNIYTGQLKQGLELLTKAENILKKENSNIHNALLTDQYNILTTFLSLPELVSVYNTKSLYYLRSAEGSDLKKYIESKIYLNMGQPKQITDSLLLYYQKAKNSISQKDINTAAYIANHYLSANKPNEAQPYIKNILDKLQKEKSKNMDNPNIFYIVGVYYVQIKNYSQAEKYFLKALKIISSRKRTIGYYALNVYQQLAEIYKTKGNIIQEQLNRDLYNRDYQMYYREVTETTSLINQKFISDIKTADKSAKRKELITIFLTSILSIISGLVIFSYIQALHRKRRKMKQNADYIKKRITSKLDDELIILVKNNDSSFLVKFQQAYPDFLTRLLKINNDLESTELSFCALLKLNLSSKEIADYTFIQVTSVHQRKRRLRKRLNILPEEDIYKFLNELV
ncbi:TPA: hypothetical protein ACWX1I_003167 [Elizabethkingia anophelis]